MTGTVFLFFVFLLSIVSWVFLNGREGKYDFRTVLDRYTPFIPSFALVYIGTYGLIGAASLTLLFSSFGFMYFLSMSIAMYSAAVLWYLFPARSFRPQIEIAGYKIHTLVFRFYRGNSHGNAFPSAHTMTSFITAYYLSLLYPPGAIAFFSIAALIALSTLFIMQHHVLDVLAGILWAAAAIALVQYGIQ